MINKSKTKFGQPLASQRKKEKIKMQRIRTTTKDIKDD